MKTRYILLLSVLVIILSGVKCSKILGIIWTPSKSHHVAGSALLKSLAKKGHEVHVLSSFIDDIKIPNYKQELLTGNQDILDNLMNTNLFTITRYYRIFETLNNRTNDFWKNEAIQRLVKTKPHYDVSVIVTFFNDFIFALPHYLETPYVVFSSLSSNPAINKFVGNPNLPYSNHIFFDYPIRSFHGRLTTVTANAVTTLMERYLLHPFQNEINRKFLPEAPLIDDLIKNVSLVLVNSHYAFETPKPNVSNFIQIGGFRSQDVQKLPNDLQTYLDTATDGAILFSFGTNVKLGIGIGINKIRIILKGLGKMSPVKVLFKSNIELTHVPENVKVLRWLPQNDVLAHPNLKLFISHGGLGGKIEAIHHGVPMLGIPFFADQHSNIAKAIDEGWAIKLEVDQIDERTFGEALQEIWNNPKYTASIKKRSSLLRNQPIKPLDTAIWWIEHIIEYKGGEHLRNIATELEWYQLYMVDIVLFYVFLFIILLMILISVTKWTITAIFNKNIESIVKIKKN